MDRGEGLRRSAGLCGDTRASGIGAALAAAIVLLLLLGCTAQPATSPGPASGAARLELTAVVPASGAALPGRVVEHLDNMATLAKPMTDFCDEVGRDLNAYYELAAPDFGAVAAVELTAEQRAAILDAYQRLSTVAGRCISDAEGRRFNQRLVREVRPLGAP